MYFNIDIKVCVSLDALFFILKEKKVENLKQPLRFGIIRNQDFIGNCVCNEREKNIVRINTKTVLKMHLTLLYCDPIDRYKKMPKKTTERKTREKKTQHESREYRRLINRSNAHDG